MARVTMASLQYELNEAKAKITSLENSLKNTQDYRKWDQEARNKAQAELDQAHILLDTIGCPLERKTKQEYGEVENPLAIRIGVWLAKKAGL
jgi:hypothetical protein